LPSQTFQVVAESNQRAKAGKRHISDYKGHISSPKGTVPLGRGLVKTLTHTPHNVNNQEIYWHIPVKYFLAKKVYKGRTNLWSCCC